MLLMGMNTKKDTQSLTPRETAGRKGACRGDVMNQEERIRELEEKERALMIQSIEGAKAGAVSPALHRELEEVRAELKRLRRITFYRLHTSNHCFSQRLITCFDDPISWQYLDQVLTGAFVPVILAMVYPPLIVFPSQSTIPAQDGGNAGADGKGERGSTLS